METLIHGDCLEKLKELPENSIDSIVTDPPYGLSFMGKKWDYDVPSIEIWQECLRVLKPGGHLLSFAGTRTQHRMAVRIEDAGFEIRDMIAWVYGSGFPKSHNVANSVDKKFGCSNRGHAISSGSQIHPTTGEKRANGELLPAYKARTEEGKQWEGWGTALKPALEPITVARKPLSEKTVAENVLTHGTGGMNIDGSRVSGEETPINKLEKWSGFGQEKRPNYTQEVNTKGRWPANLIHSGEEEVLECFPNESHRFFYSPKASKKDRDDGLPEGERSNHPTVKPTELMRYLVKLVTPPGGTVLDPFTGSGSTGKACKLEGFDFIGIEKEEEYIKIAEARIKAVSYTPTLL